MHRTPDPARRQLAHHLAPFTVHVVAGGAGPDGVLGLENRVADALVTRELAAIVAGRPELRRRVQVLHDATDDAARRQAVTAVERKLEMALRRRPDLVDTLWPLLAPSVAAPAPAENRAERPPRAVVQVVGRVAAASLLVAAIAVVILVAVWAGDRRLGALGVIDLAAIGILSFLPGWLYIRFIGQRAGAVWDEFVLNLHRLGLDQAQYLPQPPVNSEYFRPWYDGGGAALSRHRNIYRQKFDAYYGRSVSSAGQDSGVRTETLFPIVLATVVFAIGWTALLWNSAVTAAPATTVEVLAFGFLGAYLFDLQMLVRRFFQSDLKPSAYASAVLRVVVVLIIVLVMHQLPVFADGSRAHEEAVVAFVVGLFPLVGLQALNRLVAVVLRGAVPTLRNNYPLSDLEGLNLWYEARLLEEGIEDMQNLVSANMVEVLLHTRVPVARLVDWNDQALLYLHLRPRRDDGERPRKHPRDALASVGVRSATTFLKAFPIAPDQDGMWADPRVAPAVDALVERSPELAPAGLMTIARILADEPGLRPVRNWKAWTCRDDREITRPTPPVPLHTNRPTPTPADEPGRVA
jgi:hypothetical protein